MTAMMLLDALVARMEELFAGWTLTAKDGSRQAVKVFAQYLPQPKAVTVKPKGDAPIQAPEGYGPADIESCFPCVVVRLDEGRDKEEGALDAARADVHILVGAYDESPDCQGYRDVVNVIEAVRQDLLAMPGRVLDRKWRLEIPTRWYLFDDQPWPVWFGQIETTWEIGRPLMPPRNDRPRR